MSVYVIVQGKVENRGLLDQYVAKAGPAIKSHQGRTIAFDEEPEVVEGRIDYPRTVIVEFPSMTAFRAWYDSPEYQSSPSSATEGDTRYAYRSKRLSALLMVRCTAHPADEPNSGERVRLDSGRRQKGPGVEWKSSRLGQVAAPSRPRD